MVAYQQNLHFKQLFAVLKKMGHEWADGCEHVAVRDGVARGRDDVYPPGQDRTSRGRTQKGSGKNAGGDRGKESGLEDKKKAASLISVSAR